MNTHQRDVLLFRLWFAFVAVLALAVTGAIVYVVVHFIRKVW